MSQISLTDCVYFPNYSVKCISCFMPGHLMTSWNLKMQNSKIWFSRERKELLKWNKKHFSWFDKCFRLRKWYSANVADTNFKFLKPKLMQCFVDWIFKPGLISYWNKNQNMKSYFPANKYSGSDFNLSSHSNLPYENCCFVGYSVSIDKRILEY